MQMLSVQHRIIPLLEKLVSSENFFRQNSAETKLQLTSNIVSDFQEKALLQIIFEYALKAELVGPGGFTECVRNTLVSLKSGLYGNIPSQLNDDTRVLECASRAVDGLLIKNCIKSILSLKASTAVQEALNLAGLSGKILLKKSNDRNFSVELVQGYTFDLLCTTISSRLEIEKPLFLPIDGFIESVSEINSLLISATETKIPLVIFARGFADDVISTLALNTAKETMTVIPVVVKFDLEGMNTLNDISVASGAQLISSAKGDLISSVKFNSLKSVESVALTKSSVVFVEKSTSQAVAGHVFMLHNKLASAVEGTHNLFEARIKSLTPNVVYLRIPQTLDAVRVTQSIDVVLRMIKSMISHGVVNNEPTATKLAANFYGRKCLEAIQSVGFILET